ncbi:MAG: C39 family peptidase [Alphaproteobacteria bacterium]|nr:C39 family peptidase [Alphaproteobacteria bacterium]
MTKSPFLSALALSLFLLAGTAGLNAAQAEDDASTLPPAAIVGVETLNVRPGESFEGSEDPTNRASVDVGNGMIETVSVRVISWRDLPFQTVKRQAFDFSCGSAAVATLLSYVYGLPASEEHVFKTMFAHGNQNKIRREGFSLLDMSRYLNSRGLKAKGYRLDFARIEKHKAPFIALIKHDGYSHFVVVKSMKGPLVLVGDPSKGNVVYTRQDFAKVWNGISLVVTNEARKAREAFADSADWHYARATAFAALGNDIVNDSVDLPFPNWQIAPTGLDIIQSTVINNVNTVTNSASTTF